MARDGSCSLVIRLAASVDAARIAQIYAPFVTDTIVSFESTPPDAVEMRCRIESSIAGFPWLVCARDDDICGFAYASKHRSREAYRWCVECSVYVSESWRRRGVGRALYRSLFAVLAAQGYCNVYAGIALPNDASERFHASLGFSRVGVYERIGYKLGAWRDVSWSVLRLTESEREPVPPVSVSALCEREDVSRYFVSPVT